jgi:hypothetical protein
MAERRGLVLVGGIKRELPSGDSLILPVLDYQADDTPTTWNSSTWPASPTDVGNKATIVTPAVISNFLIHFYLEWNVASKTQGLDARVYNETDAATLAEITDNQVENTTSWKVFAGTCRLVQATAAARTIRLQFKKTLGTAQASARRGRLVLYRI